MIFPKLNHENIVQVDDKTRLSASLSFVTDDETVTDIEVKPESSESYISVFSEDQDRWFLDWAYLASGEKTVSVKVTTLTGNLSKDFILNVISETDDKLFSKDNDLFPLEPEILRYLPQGKNSFIYVHRKAQEKILTFLDEQRIWKADGSRFSKDDIFDKEEFKRWSIYMTLLIIFESMQVSNNDIFQEKKEEYRKEMIEARNRASLRLDVDGDNVVDQVAYRINSTSLVRR